MTLTLSVGVNNDNDKWHIYSESLGIVWMQSEGTRNVALLEETHSLKKKPLF